MPSQLDKAIKRRWRQISGLPHVDVHAFQLANEPTQAQTTKVASSVQARCGELCIYSLIVPRPPLPSEWFGLGVCAGSLCA
jgi:hypothetical protein